MKIIFFNQFHNGDCFVGKGWVRNIMQQIPEAEFAYAHNNHPDIVKDLGCEQLTLSDIPDIDRKIKFAKDTEGTIYINTWCGAFQGELFGYNQHSNYIIQHQMYDFYCAALSQELGRKITQQQNIYDYLPFIDWEYYPDTALADVWVKQHVSEHLVLFCNGSANSGQSAVGDFRNVIDRLSQDFTEHVFVVTSDIDIQRDNIYTTSSIFGKQSDLNEIAYLSQHAQLIVGKNSGPFSYCQYAENMELPHTFFCFGKLLTDCLNAGLEFPAQFKFSDQTHDELIYSMLRRELAGVSNRTGMQHITI